MIHDLNPVSNGVILLPKWDNILKIGRAGSLKSAQEKHCSMLLGAIKMLYACATAWRRAAATTYGINDDGSAKYTSRSTRTPPARSSRLSAPGSTTTVRSTPSRRTSAGRWIALYQDFRKEF